MAATKYTYSLSDFTGLSTERTRPSLDRLRQEIQSSAITIALDYCNWSSPTCDIWFKAPLSTVEVTALDGIIAAHTGEPIPDPMTADGIPIVAFPVSQPGGALPVARAPRLVGSEVIRASHNYCDPTTWWGDSVRVNAETLADSGDGLTWSSTHVNWIDVYAGKFLREHDLTNSHGVIVQVNGSTKKLKSPLEEEWGDADYSVDFEQGSVTFKESQAGQTVTASYNYENGTGWYLAPSSGRQLFLEEAEVNVSSDAVMQDAFKYEYQVYISGVGWVTVGGALYRSAWQMIQECRGSHAVIPAFGGPLRGTVCDVYQLPFIYTADRVMRSSDKIRLRVSLENGKKLLGTHASLTFYALSCHECQ